VRRMTALMLLLFLLCSLCLSGCAAQSEAPGVRLIALNMGKADCLLLLLEDRAYLIDSGYDYTYGLLRETLRQYGIQHLDGVFLTHCDKDHYGGLAALAQSDIGVDAWYAAAIYYDVKPGQHPMELAAALRGDSVRYLNAGDTLSLAGDAALRVVGPLTCNTVNENNNSLVFYVDTAEGTLLFTGDMKLEEEAELMAAGLIGPADLLKVPFHGDNSASSESFVAAVMPSVALICTSTAQEPDTPASSILKRYGRCGAAVYVTQDTPTGYELTLRSGQCAVAELAWEQPSYSIQAVIDPAQDMLTLRNSAAEDISLAGWILYSSRGEDTVNLPDDAVLPANGVYRIGTRATSEDVTLSLDMKRLWHKSKYDQAVVYDAAGRTVAVTDNGLPE